MDFTPSPSQQLLVATARGFLKTQCPPELVQRLALDERGFDAALWRRMAELGWPGLLIPGDFGGSDGSLLDVVLLVEEMGRAGLPGPFVPSAVVATSLLLGAGSIEQHKRLLPALAAGERIATLALVEDGGSFDPQALTLRCEAPGRLTGAKLFVKDAHVATDLVVALHGGDLLLLPADRPGIARLPLDTLSGEKSFEVTFDDVEVRVADRLGGGAAALAAALTAGALARTAEMVGAAQRVLDLAVEHARTRVQGGRPIGGHQAIQHACADLVRDVDTSRGLLYVAAWKASEGRPAGADVATAKAYAGEACLTVARRGHQIFGAIGYCEEHPLHLLHKRVQAASVDFGDAGLHLETVAREIGLR
jgi:alkylation response protein AidB-like acyl-CoA dehydrogenase